MTATTVKSICVWSDSGVVGDLRFLANGTHLFEYRAEWLAKEGAWAISPHFPLAERSFSGERVYNFFDNLLPEGGRRKIISNVKRLSEGDIVGLLEHLGGDTAGALVFMPPGRNPSESARLHPVELKNLWSELSVISGYAFGDVARFTMSTLSGAQNKLAVFVDADGRYYLPSDGAPSTHIVKPSPPDSSITPATAINEAFVMRLAERIGMPVPHVEFLPEINSIIVERYDRIREVDGRVSRIHQLDMCQLFNMWAWSKYEASGGASFVQMYDMVGKLSTVPDTDQRALLHWLAFNQAVGNMDSHAKNLAMLGTPGRMRLAPFYDMVCTLSYPSIFNEFALKIGGETRPTCLNLQHWTRLATEINVATEVLRDIRIAVHDRIAEVLPAVYEEMQQFEMRSRARRVLNNTAKIVSERNRRMRAHCDLEVSAPASQAHTSETQAPEPKPQPSFPRMGM